MENTSDLQPNFAGFDYTAGRRAFMRTLGLGAAGAALLSAAGGPVNAQTATVGAAEVFNFALNLEYLEAEFYLRAAFGRGLADADISGTGTLGAVTGGRQVTFATPLIQGYANEIADDEEKHVRFLRAILGGSRVARPTINFVDSFNALARFSGLGNTFDAFANETNFLLAAFVFEDVGVTAYKGAAPLIRNNEFLEATAGILAVEAYHAGIIRTVLASRGLFQQAQAISDLRDFFDGPSDLDFGIGTSARPDLVPTDSNALAISRTPAQVLAIVYASGTAQPGGFFPNGLNGAVR
ncbi:MAG: ferritin-like domain-containing protein [Methylobacterium sp.]|jgi:hypothetical protein|uniref:ferritin-like domain-containing protein n=1 Tax=unclassified Methylobacterium TaxID=2615210 RepID=UPI0011C8819F|nr:MULTISPECIES: ferritin-like domain-containing protein [unclassified Methylobacterium]MDO9428644.1 ferritin-like domain-containing protein [Methylobacterium sp.]TXM78841.1 ferritin-like domain-containing protein [Methylobacterium sp. WL69]